MVRHYFTHIFSKDLLKKLSRGGDKKKTKFPGIPEEIKSAVYCKCKIIIIVNRYIFTFLKNLDKKKAKLRKSVKISTNLNKFQQTFYKNCLNFKKIDNFFFLVNINFHF